MEGRTGKVDNIISDIISEAENELRNSFAILNHNDNRTRLSASAVDKILDGLAARLCERSSPGSRLRTKLVQLLEHEMSSEVRREIEHRFSYEDKCLAEDVVDECVMSLCLSPQCSSIKERIKESIVGRLSNYSGNVCASGDNDWIPNSRESQWSLFDSTASSCINDAFETSSLGSSNYGTISPWEKLTVERLDDLAERLHFDNNWPTRREALSIIGSFSMSDVIQSEAWPRLKIRLKELLTIETRLEESFDSGLQFHFIMLCSSSSQCVVESHGNLLETLHTLLLDLNFDNESFKPTNHNRLFRLCEVINTFQKVMPLYWSRYPEIHIRKMVEQIVLYSLDVKGFGILSPLTLFALVDPKAEWFHNWTHGQNVRRIIIECFRQYSKVLRTMSSNCVAMFESAIAGPADRCQRDYSSEVLSYSSRQLLYAQTLYVLRIIGCLISSTDGRTIFEEQLEMDSHDILIRALQLSCVSTKSIESCNDFCLLNVVVEVIGELITVGQCWGFNHGRLLNIIHDSITDLLDGPPLEEGVTAYDLHLFDHFTCMLLHCTDNYASLPFVLETFGNDFDRFVDKILQLRKDFIPSLGVTISELKTRTVKICCRLLADHNGIQMLQASGILFKIAEDWESSLRETEKTPVLDIPSEQNDLNNGGKDEYSWLKELRIVGTTPRGISALYKTNLLQDILIWIERQMNNKSRENLLANGTIMLFLSQASASCASYPTLTTHVMPFVNEIAERIWFIIEFECIRNESLIGPPSYEHVIDTAHNLLSDLICILPSSQAVKTLLGTPVTPGQHADSTQRFPYFVKLVVSSFQDWCPRTELTCTIGLRLLSVLGTDLNAWLYLESNFHIQEMLLQAQTALETEECNFPVIDEQYLLRNYFLVKMAEIGGECEKHLPPIEVTQLADFPDSYIDQFPPITSLPISQEYLVSLLPLSDPSNEIEFFLKETGVNRLDTDWLLYCREVFRNCLVTNDVQLRGFWFGDLLFYAVEALHKDVNSSSNRIEKLHPVMSFDNHLGCQLVISYGLRLRLLEDGVDAAHKFIQILNTLTETTDATQGFNWIAATVFLLLGGNVERTVAFVDRLKRLPVCRQLAGQIYSIDEFDSDNDWMKLCHSVEIVLRGELPLVANAIQRSGMTVGQIVQPWTSQCFWNILDWEEICKYLGLCIVMGADFQVYYVVAVFRHIQKELMQHVSQNDLPMFIRETRLNRFRTRDHLPFIDHLESKYCGLLLERK